MVASLGSWDPGGHRPGSGRGARGDRSAAIHGEMHPTLAGAPVPRIDRQPTRSWCSGRPIPFRTLQDGPPGVVAACGAAVTVEPMTDLSRLPPPVAGPEPGTFVVGYNPVPTANLVSTRRTRALMRFGSLVITVAINVLFLYLTRDQGGAWRWWVAGVSTAISVVYLVVSLIQLWRASRALARIGHGRALQIRREGVLFDPQGRAVFIPADQIEFVGTGGRAPVPGSNLVIRTTDGTRFRVPLMYLDAMPGTLDGAIRAYSGGRLELDVSSLDSML